MSIPGHAAHIATMANQPSTNPASCTPYATAKTMAATEPPELDYKFFTPEFLDELEEHNRSMAVGRDSA